MAKEVPKEKNFVSQIRLKKPKDQASPDQLYKIYLFRMLLRIYKFEGRNSWQWMEIGVRK